MKTPIYKALVLISTILAWNGCTVKLDSQILSSAEGPGLGQIKYDINRYPSNKLICDPFAVDPVPSVTYENGIKAELFYRDVGQDRYYKTTDYFDKTTKSDKTVFLTDVNVPTRIFTDGFTTPTGSTLAKNGGEKLVEYFGLRMKTSIILTADDEPGDYELALLSDDGANLTIKSGDSADADEILIANDGDHPTKVGCATRTVRFRPNVMLPVELSYYQGPKYHIANVLVWRKATEAGKDPSCNKVGNQLFWDFNNKSEPQPEFINMQSRGWKILKPGNFMVARDSGDYNPCAPAVPPVISNFEVGEVILQSVGFHWTTDLPATSQVLLINTRTGLETLTDSDNTLRVDHTITVDGLDSGTTYKVRAISIGQDLGRAQSPELQFTTQ
jgi:hypothetical protein